VLSLVKSVDVRGDEYAFVMPDEAEAGVVRFNVSNTGEELHEYALGRLAEGKTLDDVKAFLESGQEDAPEWFTDVGGVPVLSPGEELGLTRELEAGTYVFLCFLPSPKGVPHVALGMLKSFELNRDSGAKLPDPDAVIVANDSGYEIPDLSSGQQTIELQNADDKEWGSSSSSYWSPESSSPTWTASSRRARKARPPRSSTAQCRQSRPDPRSSSTSISRPASSTR
jgi:hypothetical protein